MNASRQGGERLLNPLLECPFLFLVLTSLILSERPEHRVAEGERLLSPASLILSERPERPGAEGERLLGLLPSNPKPPPSAGGGGQWAAGVTWTGFCTCAVVGGDNDEKVGAGEKGSDAEQYHGDDLGALKTQEKPDGVGAVWRVG